MQKLKFMLFHIYSNNHIVRKSQETSRSLRRTASDWLSCTISFPGEICAV